ncbi:MAG: hypothetical protein WAS73_04240 [Defluviicoccus sp.]
MNADRLLPALVRNVVLLALWGGFWLASFGIEVIVLLAHYAAISSGFFSTGSDPTPLSQNEMLGWLFSAMGGDNATMGDLLAVAMAVITAMLALLVVHLLLGGISFVVAVWRARRESPGSYSWSSFAWESLLIDLLLLTVFVVAVVVIARYDFDLYGLRSLIDHYTALDAGEPGTFADDLVPPAVGDLARTVAQSGAYAYTTMFVVASLLVYAVGRKVDATFEALCAVTASLFTGNSAPADNAPPINGDAAGNLFLYGYDAAGNPVYDARSPLTFDADGNQLVETQAGSSQGEVFEADHENDTGNVAADDSAPINDDNSAASTTQANADPEDELQEVYSSIERPAVSFRTARNDEQYYYIDPANNRIWWRADWEALHATKDWQDRAA